MICFWGCHYFAYYRDFAAKSASDCWKLYDDSRVVSIGDWDSVLQRCLDGKEKPILLLFEELKTKDAQYRGTHKHYLNNLIGQTQWQAMFKSAYDTDKDLEMLNAPAAMDATGGSFDATAFETAGMGMSSQQMQEQMKILMQI